MIGRSGGADIKPQLNAITTSATQRKLAIYNCSNRIGLVRARLRPAGAINKAGDRVLLVALDPLVSSLSADAVVEVMD